MKKLLIAVAVTSSVLLSGCAPHYVEPTADQELSYLKNLDDDNLCELLGYDTTGKDTPLIRSVLSQRGVNPDGQDCYNKRTIGANKNKEWKNNPNPVYASPSTESYSPPSNDGWDKTLICTGLKMLEPTDNSGLNEIARHTNHCE